MEMCLVFMERKRMLFSSVIIRAQVCEQGHSVENIPDEKRNAPLRTVQLS